MKINTIAKLHLSVTLGAFIPLPFGNVIIPYIYWKIHKNDGKQIAVQACNILNFQLLASLAFYISLTVIWYVFLQFLKESKEPYYSSMAFPLFLFICVSIIYPILIVIYLLTQRKIKEFYPNIIHIFNYKS